MADMASDATRHGSSSSGPDRFVCTLGFQGRFTSINPAGAAISGYTAE
jgi:hypothetical protein